MQPPMFHLLKNRSYCQWVAENQEEKKRFTVPGRNRKAVTANYFNYKLVYLGEEAFWAVISL